MMRPAPLWSWNDKLEPEILRRQIREMVAQGWGGFFMHPRVGYTTHYLSDKWMAAVHACIDEARQLGVSAWIYDEDRWPSGYGGGVVAEIDPAFRSRGLVIRAKGTEKTNDRVIQEIDVRGQPFLIAEQVTLDRVWFNGSTYPDLMNADAMRAFIDKVLERYKEACGKDFGGVIPGVFTDEPLYLDNGGIDSFGVPWSTKLPAFFQQLKGYDIHDHLPKLFLDEGDYRRVRFDFYDVAARLFRESFTKQYYDWCDQNGLIFTGHFQAEDSLRLQCQWTGDVMAHYPWMHHPGIDQLERKVTQFALVKQLTSVTDQLGKARAFCEAYGISGAQVSFFHRKWISDWLIGLGINFINPHLFHYSLRGPRKRDCPPNIGYQAPWWPDERGLSDYIARLCTVLTGGKRRVDVLMLQPLSSVWCDYSPLQWDSGYAPVTIYDTPYQDLCAKLCAAQIDYHLGNETIMAEHAAVEGDRLRVGKQTYRLVVLPPTLNLRSSTLKLLQDLLAAGGRVLVIGPTPTHVDGVPTEVKLDGAQHAARIAWGIDLIPPHLPERLVALDRRTGKLARDLVIHSRDHCHFIANISEYREADLQIKVPEETVAAFDPATGETYRLSREFNVTLAPAGSLTLLVNQTGKTAPKLLGSGAMFGEPGEQVAHADQFAIELLEENLLRVDEVELEIAGKTFAGPVRAAWKEFYAVEDGTPFRATYRFRSAHEVTGGFAVIDSAENLDVMTLNGEALKVAGTWKDIALNRVPLPVIRPGENTLVLTGKKVNVAKPSGVSHRRTRPGPEPRETQVEDVLIAGKFGVRQVGAGRYEIGGTGTPFYAGRAVYRCELDLPAGELWLELHGLAAASARVRLNGKDCGTIRWQPHLLIVTANAGRNQLEIELATTLFNAIGPTHHQRALEIRKVGPREYSEPTVQKRDHELEKFELQAITVSKL